VFVQTLVSTDANKAYYEAILNQTLYSMIGSCSVKDWWATWHMSMLFVKLQMQTSYLCDNHIVSLITFRPDLAAEHKINFDAYLAASKSPVLVCKASGQQNLILQEAPYYIFAPRVNDVITLQKIDDWMKANRQGRFFKLPEPHTTSSALTSLSHSGFFQEESTKEPMWKRQQLHESSDADVSTDKSKGQIRSLPARNLVPGSVHPLVIDADALIEVEPFGIALRIRAVPSGPCTLNVAPLGTGEANFATIERGTVKDEAVDSNRVSQPFVSNQQILEYLIEQPDSNPILFVTSGLILTKLRRDTYSITIPSMKWVNDTEGSPNFVELFASEGRVLQLLGYLGWNESLVTFGKTLRELVCLDMVRQLFLLQIPLFSLLV